MYTKKIKYWGGQTEEKNDKKSKNKMQNGKKTSTGRGGEKKNGRKHNPEIGWRTLFRVLFINPRVWRSLFREGRLIACEH